MYYVVHINGDNIKLMRHRGRYTSDSFANRFGNQYLRGVGYRRRFSNLFFTTSKKRFEQMRVLQRLNCLDKVAVFSIHHEKNSLNNPEWLDGDGQIT